MAKRLKRPRDPVELGKLIGDILTGQVDDKASDNGKNPAAVARGRLGGKTGGAARAKSLSDDKRKEIASKAAKARWKAKARSGA
jgi:hypothetical protein